MNGERSTPEEVKQMEEKAEEVITDRQEKMSEKRENKIMEEKSEETMTNKQMEASEKRAGEVRERHEQHIRDLIDKLHLRPNDYVEITYLSPHGYHAEADAYGAAMLGGGEDQSKEKGQVLEIGDGVISLIDRSHREGILSVHSEGFIQHFNFLKIVDIKRA